MAETNGYFQRMCNDAISELVKEGDWRKVPTNTLLMACFGMAFNHLASKILAPLKWGVGVALTGLLWWIISSIIFNSPGG